MPIDGDLGDLNTRATANNSAVVAEDGDGRGGLGQHQHLDIEDPALGVHVRDDMGQRRAREKLESALRVADARGGGGCQDHEDEVEGAHKEIAQGGSLNHGLAADEVAPRPDCHAPVRAVDYFLAPLEELAQVRELGGSVCVGEERVLAAYVAEAVRYAAAFAAVALESHDAQNIVESVFAREFEGDLRRAVLAAVVYDYDLVPR